MATKRLKTSEEDESKLTNLLDRFTNQDLPSLSTSNSVGLTLKEYTFLTPKSNPRGEKRE